MAFIDILRDDKLVLTVGSIIVLLGLQEYAGGRFNPILLMVIGSLIIIYRRTIVRWL